LLLPVHFIEGALQLLDRLLNLFGFFCYLLLSELFTLFFFLQCLDLGFERFPDFLELLLDFPVLLDFSISHFFVLVKFIFNL